MRWARHVARVGEVWLEQGFCGQFEGTRPLGRPKCRWEGNIKMGLEEVG